MKGLPLYVGFWAGAVRLLQCWTLDPRYCIVTLGSYCHFTGVLGTASFVYIIVSVTPFFPTKTLISFLCDTLAVLFKLFLKDFANMLSVRPLWGR